MSRALITILALVMIGCLANPPVRQAEATGAEEERLVAIAKRELKRRDLPLPVDYTVVVENVTIGDETGNPPREVYGVWFTFTYRGKRDAFYSVYINKGSDRIDQVSDLRNAEAVNFKEPRALTGDVVGPGWLKSELPQIIKFDQCDTGGVAVSADDRSVGAWHERHQNC